MNIQHLSFQAEVFLKALPVDSVSLFTFSSSPGQTEAATHEILAATIPLPDIRCTGIGLEPALQ